MLPAFRGAPASKALMAETFELSARKGYRLARAQIKARLLPTWHEVLRCRVVAGRERLTFSGFDDCEIERPLAAHPEAITIRAAPFQIIRPEGDWDTPGEPDRSTARPAAAGASQSRQGPSKASLS